MEQTINRLPWQLRPQPPQQTAEPTLPGPTGSPSEQFDDWDLFLPTGGCQLLDPRADRLLATAARIAGRKFKRKVSK